MTLLVAFSTLNHALIAADTGRWDTVEDRWLAPAEKVWRGKSLLIGKAGDGSVADPEMPNIVNRLETAMSNKITLQTVVESEMPKFVLRKSAMCVVNYLPEIPPRLAMIAAAPGLRLQTFSKDTSPPLVSIDQKLAVVGTDAEYVFCEAEQYRPGPLADLEAVKDWASDIVANAIKRNPDKLNNPVGVWTVCA